MIIGNRRNYRISRHLSWPPVTDKVIMAIDKFLDDTIEEEKHKTDRPINKRVL